MKKNFLLKNLRVIAILVVLVIGFASSLLFASASEQRELKVYVDDKELQFSDAKPYINEFGRTMVPIRAIAESFGAKVEWVDGIKRVIITYDDIEIRFIVGYIEDVMLITNLKTEESKTVYLDSKPVIRNNRTYLPYRAITEAFGYKVYWDEKEYKVTVDTKNRQPVFYINPGLSDNYYQCIANFNTDFDNLVPLLKSPNIKHELTDEMRQSHISRAQNYIENIIGNVDYTKEFDPEFPTAPFTPVMEDVYNDAVKNSIIREVKFIADPSDVEILLEHPIEDRPYEIIVLGRLEFIYHEASDEYLDRFEGKLKKGVWYSTKIAVRFSLKYTDLVLGNAILDNTFEEITSDKNE
ncbi:MAG TPA: copper amine oxidase N-terminal domain-containing protein [Acetivibrio sp.]|uniref:copper amine oxidase N-terminal domain-containing protein n=1 Tax=Acetivibrio sp. TaxID=1872092 RepID=UPI002BDCA0C0|nr:copper amine oxidase N-terminal domain-containing protein [Acetivibrio sp.]HOM02118.1 copper amine oxidase N-terminal domain-containing protein [Acetivibrio sp.]